MTETPSGKFKGGLRTVIGIVLLTVVSSAATTWMIAYYRFSAHTTPSNSLNPIPVKQPGEAVAALGWLEPKGEVIHVSVPTLSEAVRVEQLLVKLGDRLKTGQIIAILYNRDRLQSALDVAQTQVQVAQARLKQAQSGAKVGKIEAQRATIDRLQAELQGQINAQTATIERIKAELHNATTECNRYQHLYQNGAISASQRDNICLQEDTFREQLAEAKATRERTVTTLHQQLTEAKATLEEIAEIRPVDVAVIQGELKTAKASVKQAEANLALAYVRSPQDGQILKLHALAGEIVGEKGIVELGKTDQMYAVAEVYETDIDKVHPRQRATIRGAGFRGELSGTVDEVGLQIGKKDVLGTDPAADVDSRVVEVKIRLDSNASKQVSGLTNLQVTVVIDLSS